MRIVFLLLFSVLLALPVFGADSTSFDPTRVAVTAKGSGVPVGTIIAWPVATNPDDMDNWLECNGQSVNPSVYPELSAVIGHQVPDLRGLFLRGYGSQAHIQNNGTTVGVTSTLHSSGQLGQVQGDASRNIVGSFGAKSRGMGYEASGVINSLGMGGGAHMTDGWGSERFQFDVSRVVPTSVEIRPVNVAVRYLIRARP